VRVHRLPAAVALVAGTTLALQAARVPEGSLLNPQSGRLDGPAAATTQGDAAPDL
jgi:hypothetical protein